MQRQIHLSLWIRAMRRRLVCMCDYMNLKSGIYLDKWIYYENMSVWFIRKWRLTKQNMRAHRSYLNCSAEVCMYIASIRFYLFSLYGMRRLFKWLTLTVAFMHITQSCIESWRFNLDPLKFFSLASDPILKIQLRVTPSLCGMHETPMS